MSDLTRRVLKEFYDWWKVHREDSTDALSDPGRDLIHAAPILARQVEAVEALADRLETEGTAGVRVPTRTPHDSGWHDSQIIAAARIRDALHTD